MIKNREFFKKCVDAFESTQKYKSMEYPAEFIKTEGFRVFKIRRHFKIVQEYKNYARYVDLKTGLYECFSKVDFINGTGIEVIE